MVRLEETDLVAAVEAVRFVVLVEPRGDEEPCVDRTYSAVSCPDIAVVTREEEPDFKESSP